MLTLFRTIIISLLVSSLLLACSHTPNHSEVATKKQTKSTDFSSNKLGKGEQIADIAHSLLGSPYKYGGATPKGFDCSGLVVYTHGKLGIRTARTSLQQYKSAKNVRLNELHSGDLVFFKLGKSVVSHVGIYVGNGKFIHAPKSGKRVAVNNLNDSYWRPRIVSGGRLY
ncbi:MAG: C40 family peptidase [Gammaproteobacteria bacterium]